MDPIQLQQVLTIFKAEADEHLQKLNEGLLLLERESDESQRQALFQELFREAHNLKGAARAVDFRQVEEIAHKVESLLSALKQKQVAITRPLIELMYSSLDVIGKLVELNFKENSTHREIFGVNQLLQALENGALGRAFELDPDKMEVAAKPTPKENQEAAPRKKSTANGTKGPRKQNSDSAAGSTKSNPEGQLLAGQEIEETIRVSTPKLNKLMARANELMEKKIEAEQRVIELKQIRDEIRRLYRDGAKSKSARYDDGATLDSYYFPATGGDSWLKGRLQIIASQMDDYYRKLSKDIKELSASTRNLQEEIKQVRMLPMATILSPFKRMIRDMAAETNKLVNVTFTGAETEVDKKILEDLKDPLTHLFRNALAHGIETPEQRRQLNKSESGVISFHVHQKGNQLVLELSDDGAGIDLEKIRTEAVSRKVVSPDELQEMKNHELIDLIFRPGFSTNSIITDLSGRGVGLDVVRQTAEKLHGVVHVKSEKNKGTSFILKLPISLVTLQCILLVVAGRMFAIPTLAVDRIIRVSYEEIKFASGREMIELEGRPVAVVSLAKILELPEMHPGRFDDNKISLIVVSVNETLIAFIVDRFIGNQEIVIKPLGKQLVRVRNIAGATILGDGQVVLMLNVSDLSRSATKMRLTSGRPKHEIETAQKKHVLVIDDSITTRTLEKNILEVAGYDVTTAVDGEDGLRMVNAMDFDAIVTDIQMPNMDGFEFTRQIKDNVRFKQIPVILVTSLDSKQDKERGIEVGADAYIVKKSFDQRSLLETLEQLA
ncbi:MAG: hybrid sensor histidine kinase/response regulator [Candidatus Zhuqueibacterota bacterium]